jgi:hypothetical protein
MNVVLQLRDSGSGTRPNGSRARVTEAGVTPRQPGLILLLFIDLRYRQGQANQSYE